MAANTIITSTVTGGTNSHTTVAEEANAVATDFVTQGVVGAITLNSGSGGTGSFCVNADASPDMGVTVKAGQAYVTATPSSQDSQILRARASSDYTAYTINANSSGSTKYDWIYLKVDATKANNPASDASDVTSIYTSRSSSNSSDNGSPPTYGLLLAIVTVVNGASSITNANITDKRVNTSIGGQGGSLVVTQPSTGQDAVIQTAGGDANINLRLNPKGTGVIEVGENGSAVSQVSAVGSDTNIPLNLASKGTGEIQWNGTGVSGAWAAWTINVTTGSGSFTTVSATGRYKQVGKIVYAQLVITITTVGTAGDVRFNLPVTAQNTNGVAGWGREDSLNGKMVIAKFNTSSVGFVSYYDNTLPNASGAVLRLNLMYEAA